MLMERLTTRLFLGDYYTTFDKKVRLSNLLYKINSMSPNYWDSDDCIN
jgi:hypothetical protein